VSSFVGSGTALAGGLASPKGLSRKLRVSCRFQSIIRFGWMLYRYASSAMLLSLVSAASVLNASNPGVWFRLVLLLIMLSLLFWLLPQPSDGEEYP